jgi:hypothetical protein
MLNPGGAVGQDWGALPNFKGEWTENGTMGDHITDFSVLAG